MFNPFKKKSIEIVAPTSGEILPLSASPDAAFAEGMMGEGVCINPSENIVVAPFDCSIDIFHTKHATGCNGQGVEMIVHIGMNTVALNGEGFEALVPLQAEVKCSTPLIKFDRESLLSKVETLITPVVIVEKPEKATLEILVNSGHVKAGDVIMKINL